MGYNIGYAATEVLVAIGGPQSTMALLGETASGLSWAEAFQAVYGITWKEGSDILGKVLSLTEFEILTFYLGKIVNYPLDLHFGHP